MKSFIAAVIMLISFVSGAAAQTEVQAITLPKNIVLIKDVHSVPGMYCAQERPSRSFDIYSFTAFEQSLMLVEHVSKCLKRLPKGFELREESSYPHTLLLDHRKYEYANVTCSFKKFMDEPGRYTVTFPLLHIVKQSGIDECFRRAFDGPNLMVPIENKNTSVVLERRT